MARSISSWVPSHYYNGMFQAPPRGLEDVLNEIRCDHVMLGDREVIEERPWSISAPTSGRSRSVTGAGSEFCGETDLEDRDLLDPTANNALEVWDPLAPFKTVVRVEEAFGIGMKIGDIIAREDLAKAKAIISRYLGKP